MLKISLLAAAALCAAAAPARAAESTPDAVQRTASYAELDRSTPAGIAVPGMPMRLAEAALRRAGYDCDSGRVVDGVVSCSLTSVVGDSSEDSLQEVTVRVRIAADANGAVAAATVRRSADGG